MTITSIIRIISTSIIIIIIIIIIIMRRLHLKVRQGPLRAKHT